MLCLVAEPQKTVSPQQAGQVISGATRAAVAGEEKRGHYLLELKDLRRSDGLPCLVAFLQQLVKEGVGYAEKKKSQTIIRFAEDNNC